MKDKFPAPPPGAPKCDNIESGMIAFCIKGNLFVNCPNLSTDDECKKTKEWANCFMA